MIGISIRLIDLVQCNNDRNFSRLGVVNSFTRLGHDPVICCDHDYSNVRHLGATCAHGCECLVTRRIEERNFLPVYLNLVSANILSDAACFTRRHLCFTDGIEQRGLTMVNVTHNGDNRRDNNGVVFVARGHHDFVCR